MFKRYVASFLLVASLILNPTIAKAEETKERIILIDPGHGGIDGGGHAKDGTLEKEINLAISLKLKKALEDEGFKVFSTREEDKGLYDESLKVKQKKVQDLKKRCEMKKETNCDIFISIHQNMYVQSAINGAQVWYASNEKSKRLAELLQASLKETLEQNNNRVAKDSKDDYRILRDGFEGASVIVECGFLSNPTESELLKDEKYQDKIVSALVKGIKSYYKE